MKVQSVPSDEPGIDRIHDQHINERIRADQVQGKLTSGAKSQETETSRTA